MKLDYSKITDVEIEGINYKDAWRFSDAHIAPAIRQVRWVKIIRHIYLLRGAFEGTR